MSERRESPGQKGEKTPQPRHKLHPTSESGYQPTSAPSNPKPPQGGSVLLPPPPPKKDEP
jgi:hypothetical protein